MLDFMIQQKVHDKKLPKLELLAVSYIASEAKMSVDVHLLCLPSFTLSVP